MNSVFDETFKRLLEDITTKRNKLNFDYSKKGGNIDTSLGKSSKNAKFVPRITTLPTSRVQVLSAYSKQTGDDHITNILKSLKKSKDASFKMNDSDYKQFLKRTALFFYKNLKASGIDTILVMESSSPLAKDIAQQLKEYFSNTNIQFYNGMVQKNINNLRLDFGDAALSDDDKRSLTNFYNKTKANNEFAIKKVRAKHRKFFVDWIEINQKAIKSITNKNVLVFDDYLTTGSTLDAVGLTIKNLSPKSVKMITIIK